MVAALFLTVSQDPGPRGMIALAVSVEGIVETKARAIIVGECQS